MREIQFTGNKKYKWQVKRIQFGGRTEFYLNYSPMKIAQKFIDFADETFISSWREKNVKGKYIFFIHWLCLGCEIFLLAILFHLLAFHEMWEWWRTSKQITTKFDKHESQHTLQRGGVLIYAGMDNTRKYSCVAFKLARDCIIIRLCHHLWNFTTDISLKTTKTPQILQVSVSSIPLDFCSINYLNPKTKHILVWHHPSLV